MIRRAAHYPVLDGFCGFLLPAERFKERALSQLSVPENPDVHFRTPVIMFWPRVKRKCLKCFGESKPTGK